MLKAMARCAGVAATCVLLAAGPWAAGDAEAQAGGLRNGFYVQALVGPTLMWDADIKSSSAGLAGEQTFYIQGGAMGSVGYRLFGALRVEGEFAYRQHELDKLKLTNPGALDPEILTTQSADDLYETYSGLANVYWDINTGSRFNPYIGGGFGGSYMLADVRTNGPVVQVTDDNDTVFAYQGMGGLSITVSDELDLVLGYRYFATLDPSFSDATGASFDTEYQTHNIDFGIRVKF